MLFISIGKTRRKSVDSKFTLPPGDAVDVTLEIKGVVRDDAVFYGCRSTLLRLSRMVKGSSSLGVGDFSGAWLGLSVGEVI